MLGAIQNLDVSIFRWLNSWAGISQFFDWAIVFRATYLWYVIVAAVLVFFAATFLPKFRRYRRQNLELFIFAFVSAIVSRLVVTELIRFFYDRARPFDLPAEVLTKAGVDRVYQLIPHVSGGSFPSGHASLAFAVAMAVYYYYPKTSILFFLAAFSIGLGRVAAGVHWPSDILGGAFVGIASAWLLDKIYQRFLEKK